MNAVKRPKGWQMRLHLVAKLVSNFRIKFIHDTKQRKKINQVKFILNESELNPPPLGRKCCRILENGMICNLPLNHDGDYRNMKNGTNLRCGVFDYEKNQYSYQQPLLSPRSIQTTFWQSGVHPNEERKEL